MITSIFSILLSGTFILISLDSGTRSFFFILLGTVFVAMMLIHWGSWVVWKKKGLRESGLKGEKGIYRAEQHLIYLQTLRWDAVQRDSKTASMCKKRMEQAESFAETTATHRNATFVIFSFLDNVEWPLKWLLYLFFACMFFGSPLVVEYTDGKEARVRDTGATEVRVQTGQ